MLEYTARRVAGTVPVVLGILLITFIVLYMIPGDPVATIAGPRANPETLKRMALEMGLDKPVLSQFTGYTSRILRGDFGRSVVSGRPISGYIREKFPYTIKLSVLSMIISVVTGLVLGIFGAIKRDTIFDKACTIFSVLGISIPVFLSGLVMVYFFAARLGWFPTSAHRAEDTLWPFILPAITLGIRSGAFLARVVRSSMIEVLNQDYIRTARAKGLSPFRILFSHALVNALIPVITVISLDFSSYLSGSVIIETIFEIPGLGRFAMDSILRRDYPAIQGVVLFTAMVFVFVNMVVDLLYAWINPKVRDEILGKAAS